MNYREPIKRNLRDAVRIIANPDKFDRSLFEIAWAAIKSAKKQNIYLSPRLYQQTCSAYENVQSIKPSHQVES